MKNIQKLILPVLLAIIVGILYLSYFAPSDELGSFSNFDKSNNASVPIIVKFVKEKGLTRTTDGGSVFFVIDKEGTEVRVNGPQSIPPGMNEAKTIVINGHLSGDGFHAHGIELRN